MITPQFGGPDLFEERDVERPRPGPGEDLVRVVAAGTNPVYAKVRAAGGSRGLDTAGSDNQETLEQLGTDVPIDYTRQDTVEVALDNTGGTGVDAVFDTVGGETMVDSIPATRPFGWQRYSERKATLCRVDTTKLFELRFRALLGAGIQEVNLERGRISRTTE